MPSAPKPRATLASCRRVGVGAHAHRAERVGHGHELLETGILGRVHHRQGADIDMALGAVQRDDIAFLQDEVGAGDPGCFGFCVHVEAAGADDAALAPAAGHERRVAGHAAAGGEDARGRAHAFDVFRVGFFAQQDAFPAGAEGGHGVLGGEDQHAAGGAGTGGQTLDDQIRVLLGFRIDDRVEEFIELLGFDAHDGGLFVDEPLVQHVHRHVQRGGAGALADAALQHPELAFLDGELDVEHVGEVLFERGTDGVELLVGLGHGVLHAHEVLVLLVLRVVVDRARGADAGHDVFALGVHQPLAVELVVAGGRVAGEGHAGGGGVAHVAEHHRLDVDRGAPLVRNAFDAAVGDGLLAVPALEHGRDAAPQLCHRVVRERFAEVFTNQFLERFGERLEVVCAEIGVGFAALRVLDFVELFIEDLADAFSQGGFEAFRLLHHHVGVHHDQAAVGIPDKTGVFRFGDDTGDGRGGEADVEDGVHHAGHR